MRRWQRCRSLARLRTWIASSRREFAGSMKCEARRIEVDWKLRVNVIAASMVVAVKRLAAAQIERNYETGVIVLGAEELDEMARTYSLFGRVAMEAKAGLNEAGFREFVEDKYGKKGVEEYLEVARRSGMVCPKEDCEDCRRLMRGVESGFAKIHAACQAGIDRGIEGLGDAEFVRMLERELENEFKGKGVSPKEEIYLLCMSPKDAVQWCENHENRSKLGGGVSVIAVFDPSVLRGRRGGKYLMTDAFGCDTSSPAVAEIWNQIGAIGAKQHEAQAQEEGDNQ